MASWVSRCMGIASELNASSTISRYRRVRPRRQRQPRVAEHHAGTGAAILEIREVPIVARDPLDRRIDLVERPLLARPRIGGQRADAQADRRHRRRARAAAAPRPSCGRTGRCGGSRSAARGGAPASTTACRAAWCRARAARSRRCRPLDDPVDAEEGPLGVEHRLAWSLHPRRAPAGRRRRPPPASPAGGGACSARNDARGQGHARWRSTARRSDGTNSTARGNTRPRQRQRRDRAAAGRHARVAPARRNATARQRQRVLDDAREEHRRRQRVEQPARHAAERQPEVELGEMPRRRPLLRQQAVAEHGGRQERRSGAAAAPARAAAALRSIMVTATPSSSAGSNRLASAVARSRALPNATNEGEEIERERRHPEQRHRRDVGGERGGHAEHQARRHRGEHAPARALPPGDRFRGRGRRRRISAGGVPPHGAASQANRAATAQASTSRTNTP